MLTEIPVRDWENCDAVPSTLSALLGVVVPGQLRKVETVFVVSDLQILGISSVKSETDEWLIASCVRCKRASPCAQHPDGSTGRQIDLGRWQQSMLRDVVSRVTAEGSSADGNNFARAAG